MKKIRTHLMNLYRRRSILWATEDLSGILKRRNLRLSPAEKTLEILHQKKMIRFYSKLIARGDLCFDIGANGGRVTQALSDLGARVISCEPQESYLSKLQLLFGLNKNIVIVAKAVGNREGERELYLNEENPEISTISAEFMKAYQRSGLKWSKIAPVSVTTLDRLIDVHGLPRYCKIDVEGSDVEVLEGLSRPIELISFEFHKWRLKDLKTCVSRILELGEARFNFMLGDSMSFVFKNWVSAQELYSKVVELSLKLSEGLMWGDIYAKHTTSAQLLRCENPE